MDKRIVVEHPSGLHQILGIGPKDEQPEAFISIKEGVEIDGVLSALNLVAAKRSYWLYRPLMLPEKTTRYDPAQR